MKNALNFSIHEETLLNFQLHENPLKFSKFMENVFKFFNFKKNRFIKHVKNKFEDKLSKSKFYIK